MMYIGGSHPLKYMYIRALHLFLCVYLHMLGMPFKVVSYHSKP